MDFGYPGTLALALTGDVKPLTVHVLIMLVIQGLCHVTLKGRALATVSVVPAHANPTHSQT